MIKIWRHPYSDFFSEPGTRCSMESETYRAESVYTDEVLEGIAESGFNAIWIHSQIHNLVHRPEFPEFGLYARENIEKVNILIARAAKHGIQVFLYMQPPRAVNDSETEFWKKHADVRGARIHGWSGPDDYFHALCTSTAPVRSWLRGGFEDMSRAMPDLGGYIIISASEYPSHCCGVRHTPEEACPRCTSQPLVVARLISDIYGGMRAASDTQEMIVWNWSWVYVGDPADLIPRLPRGVIFLADFERGGKQPLLGHPEHVCDEYSLSYPGPSELFTDSCALAAKYGMRIAAKYQIGATHEIGDMPNMPLIGNLYIKADWLRKNKCAGFMGCWNFGNMISANSAAFNYFSSPDAPDDADEAMRKFAEKYFPGCQAEKAVLAWKRFGEAASHYPHCIPYLYYGSTNWALGYFMPPGPMQGFGHGSWRNDERGDEIGRPGESVLEGDFTLDEILCGMTALADGWEEGVRLFLEALSGLEDRHSFEERGNAFVCGAAFRSTVHFLQLYKRKKETGSADGEFYRAVQKKELENVRAALPYVEADPRLGYHSEAHAYQFDAARLRAKIEKLEAVLREED